MQEQRGNNEQPDGTNALDPMKIVAQFRDRFPKSDLYDGYIGDGYPLCVDIPPKQFLRKGSKYILLGASALPELMTDDSLFTERFVLNETTSSLFSLLCNFQEDACQFPMQVTLDKNLVCDKKECDVDTVRVVEVTPNVFYEYAPPACVEHPFYDDAMKLNKQYRTSSPICGNPLLPVATSACCETQDNYTDAVSHTVYDIERMTFATQDSRCKAHGRQSCEYDRVDKDDPFWKSDVVYHWAFAPCNIQVKVNPEGEAAIVHDVSTESDGKVPHVNDDTRNYFGVSWTNSLYPQQTVDSCGLCETIEEVNCLCETSVEETLVFTTDPDSVEAVLSALHIGAPDPSSFDDGIFSTSSVNGFIVHKMGDSYAINTIFEVVDSAGRRHFLKNAESTVYLESRNRTRAGFSFRNPVHFMSLIPSETNTRDATYETEAILEHYFYHDNTAPFLCIRFIQRFGISNGSPRYVKSCATAFRNGTYQSGNVTFGTGRYGDLAATTAAIALDREARSVVLDVDPAYGSIREPLIKVISFMRNMEFRNKDSGRKGETDMVIFHDLDEYTGQMAYEYETVFSFFLPEFQPDGRVLAASLVAPEGQLLTMSKVLDVINGMHALIKYGLSECYEENDIHYGFGYDTIPPIGSGSCSDNGLYNRASGVLAYRPSAKTPAGIVDELATLLTSGRLSSESRQLVMAAYNDAVNQTDPAAGLRIAQQLMVATPEFHTTNPVKSTRASRPTAVPPPSNGRPYKAIIYFMFAGGCDSYNMLVPKECNSPESGGDDAYTHYVDTRSPAHLLNENLLPINGSGQVNCDTFGVHQELKIVQELYGDNDLLFFANTGVIGRPSNKSNFAQYTPAELFAHNAMQFETKSIDLFDRATGIGVLGRLTDALTKNGVSTGPVSIDTSSSALSGEPGVSPKLIVVSQYGVKRFIPQEPISMTKLEMVETIKNLNNATSNDSGFMAETWSEALIQSLVQNQELYDTLEVTDVETEFGDTDLGRKFEIVSRMIKSRGSRSSEMDVFYVEIGGFDTHADLENNLASRFREVNAGLISFVEEMKLQNLWDNVTIVQASEFARTLSPNSGAGTDHAWGGNYFMCGGSVKGGKILGQYPSDMSDTSELNVGRGRLIPTTSWDQIWPGIAQWAGVTSGTDFDLICPNRGNFPFVFNADELFENGPNFEIPSATPIPTTFPTPHLPNHPTPNPYPTPTPNPHPTSRE